MRILLWSWKLHNLDGSCALTHACISFPLAQLASPADKVVVVVSVSPQSRASLAARFGMSSSETGRRLTTFLKGLGQCVETAQAGR